MDVFSKRGLFPKDFLFWDGSGFHWVYMFEEGMDVPEEFDIIDFLSEFDEYYTNEKFKKQTIEIGLKENTPLDMFIKNNGEQGEKLRKEYQEFYDTIYSSSSSF